MNTDRLKEVMAWIKTTDIVEVAYNRGEAGFSLTTAEAPAAYAQPVSRFAAVASPAIGIVQWNRPGKARKADEGDVVAQGEVLAVIETSKGRFVDVESPSAGRLARVLVEPGSAVEFGQALFFIEQS